MTRLETWTERDNGELRKDGPGDICGDWVYASDAHELIDELEARIAELERGEYVCRKCGLRKDSEHPKGDF